MNIIIMNIPIKKRLIVLTGLLFFGTALGAQSGTAHYEIIAPSETTAALYSEEMEQRFDAYNTVFRFDPAVLAAPLRVRVFINKDEYDGYVSSKLGGAKAGAVYLHYSDPEKSELVLHRGSEEAEKVLPHQAFIQFLRAFIPNPPLWIRDGFAAYFSAFTFDEEKQTLVYEENLSWLERAKRAPADPEAVLLAEEAGSFPDTVSWAASSWALVSFFMTHLATGYYRPLTDSFMLLAPGAVQSENTRAVYNRMVLFNSIEDITKEYNAYLAGKKTFAELVGEGQKHYRAKNYATAGSNFHEAAERQKNHYVPWYYLGLVAYADKNFTEAEAFYQRALHYGGGRALVQYARGVNAAAAGQKAEAAAFLREAAALDASGYKTKCDELIGKLE